MRKSQSPPQIVAVREGLCRAGRGGVSLTTGAGGKSISSRRRSTTARRCPDLPGLKGLEQE
jgi:hypothetical protein